MPPLRRHPRGEAKAVIDATSQQFGDLLDQPDASLRGVLGDYREELTTALASLFLTLDPLAQFTEENFRTFLRSLLRHRDGKVRANPRWLPALRQRTREALARNREAAGAAAVSHIEAQAVAQGSDIVLEREDILRRGGRVLIGPERALADEFARNRVSDPKALLAAGIGTTNATLVNHLERLGGLAQRMPLSVNPYGAALAVGYALTARADHVAERLGQTEMARSYNAHAQIAIAQMGPHYLKRWDSSRDMKVCRECASYHGLTVPAEASFRHGQTAPPLHPRCRCTLTVFVVNAALDAEE